ncbi:ChbG/HpnK family deacetylase [Beijerinckia indica]|uniref:YdjC family protein n=1 Tax=Beijerinckia indica subsp. indica (strain ATCC 9039 / DSM 1715 / NCIMB 8712) TaxID=395963 RepID=B2IC23_BEII9|nr:ChbG/HpnK family deacetylase [Beijerinckia indica]ACB95278.1 YdjC family protein [Beijerinckia indica subsp. indica ATCC 9039]
MPKAGNGFCFSLCADDYALSPAVSLGIREALTARRLSATSVMTTMAGWHREAHDLRPFHPEAEIGLHLNLTSGTPLGAMPCFAPTGRLPPIGRLIKAAYGRTLPEAEIRAEISRQIDAFIDSFGAAPDYIDGHQHVQALPGIRLWLLETLAEKGLTGKLWLRDSGDSLSRIIMRGGELSKALMVAGFARGFARMAAAHGFACNEGFAGFSAFAPDENYGQAFAHFLTAPGKRHLIMCHPGHCDEELAALDPVTTSREKELAFLLSDDFLRLLDQRKARLSRLAIIRN